MRNFSDKTRTENQNTHFVFITFFFFRNRTVYEKMWTNIAEPGRSGIKIWRMFLACWILTSTNTHSQYVIVIAFPLQQWLKERASLLRYSYFACHFIRVFQFPCITSL